MAKETHTGGRAATTAVVPGRYALSVGRPRSEAAAGFEWRALNDLARLESGHTPSRSHDEYWGGSIPWIGIADAADNHGSVIYDTYQKITEEGIENSSTRLLPEGTVCLSRTASIGYVVIMGVPMCTSQDFVNWVCGPSLNNSYLRYILMLESDSIRDQFAFGSTHKTLYYPDAKAFHVMVPSLRDQQAIAEVLGALDDKIVMNQRIHECTGRLTESLFCHYFDGREEVFLDKVAEVNYVKVTPGKGRLRYIDIASVSEGDYSSPEVMDWKDAPGRAKRGVRRGDTIWSTVRPNRRSHALVLESDPDLVCSTGLVTLSPLGSGFSFVYEAARVRVFTEYLLSVAEGSAYPAVTASKFAHAPVPKATEAEITQFNAQCDPLWERAASAKAESRTLASLRDTLLPALMNGTLRVKDAEKQVGEVL